MSSPCGEENPPRPVLATTRWHGMTIGIGGWGSRRKPMSLVRDCFRAGAADVIGYEELDEGLLPALERATREALNTVASR